MHSAVQCLSSVSSADNFWNILNKYESISKFGRSNLRQYVNAQYIFTISKLYSYYLAIIGNQDCKSNSDPIVAKIL